jgi:hypothetical protein
LDLAYETYYVWLYDRKNRHELDTDLYVCVFILYGVVVSVLAIGPKVCGFRLGRGRWIFKGEKIRSTPPFGGEVKPPASYRKILRHVKEPFKE